MSSFLVLSAEAWPAPMFRILLDRVGLLRRLDTSGTGDPAVPPEPGIRDVLEVVSGLRNEVQELRQAVYVSSGASQVRPSNSLSLSNLTMFDTCSFKRHRWHPCSFESEPRIDPLYPCTSTNFHSFIHNTTLFTLFHSFSTWSPRPEHISRVRHTIPFPRTSPA